MDARKPDHHSRRPGLTGFAILVLAAMLAWGFWQAYGAWLIEGTGANGN